MMMAVLEIGENLTVAIIIVAVLATVVIAGLFSGRDDK